MVGREEVLVQLDDWLLGPEDIKWVVVTGGPGMGKSAILAAWLARHDGDGVVMAHHFIRRQAADWDQPEVIAASLAAQIEAEYPELRDPDAKPERRLLELLGNVSGQLGASGHLVIVIDGLDEARAEPGDNPLPRFLPHLVPAGIRVLCATRPWYPYFGWLQARGRVRPLDLDSDRWAASNEEAVRAFWQDVAPTYRPSLPAATLNTAIRFAEGNVLHASMLHDAWQRLPASARRPAEIPQGLAALLDQTLDGATAHEAVRTGLGILCAAQEALTLDLLAELAGWGFPDRDRFLRDARQLLLEEPSSQDRREAYRPRHGWIRQLIVERLGTIEDHHRTLARRLATWPPPVEPQRRSYAVRYALAHRITVGDWSEVHKLAFDLGFLEERVQAADVFVVEQELLDASLRCSDPDLSRDLTDLARALARESHWVREQPVGTASLIWNRLRRSGWNTAQLDARTRVPATPFLRLRCAVSRESSSLERTLHGHANPVSACAVTSDGKWVISGSDDGTIKIWDLNAGRVRATLDGHTAMVNAFAVLPERRVVSASADRTLKIWDLDSGVEVASLEGHAAGVNACAVMPDGRIISASADGSVKIWAIDPPGEIDTLHGHLRGVTACAAMPDGRRILSASADRTLKTWDIRERRELATLVGHTGWVAACAVMPDGQRAISASADRTLKLWNLDSGTPLKTLDGHSDGVNACAITPEGGRAVSAAADDSLRVWDVDAGRVITELHGHVGAVSACAVTPDGRRVVSASFDLTLKVWNLDTARALATVDAHAGVVSACAATRDGRRVVSSSHDESVKVWDAHTGQLITTLAGHTDWVNRCVWTPDGKSVISASDDETVAIWDVEVGQTLATLEASAGAARTCAMTPDGKRVVAAFHDRTIRVWDRASLQLSATLQGHGAVVTECAFTPDSKLLISASDDRTLKVWDLETGRIQRTLNGHTDRVTACAVVPGGLRVLSASSDGTLKLWELDTGTVVASLTGHTGAVRACAIAPAGGHAVSASDDRTLRVWDLATTSCFLTHRGDAAFQCVVATLDSIVAGDRLGTLWFLEWPREPSPSRYTGRRIERRAGDRTRHRGHR